MWSWCFKAFLGFEDFQTVLPAIGGGLTNAAAVHESMYGTIASSWYISRAGWADGGVSLAKLIWND
ncbi:MAG: hypothetical protein KAH99_03595 [Verrucomicrobia bacterium]|nr:hypothetical protein [Verrucomicrobiota bacterium]